jgi:hypothetical protein
MAIGIVSDPRPAGTSAFAGLVEVMEQEAHGLIEFSSVLASQRGAVSQGDRPALDATTEDIDRLMLRLTKLREQRQSMVDRLAGGTGASLAELFSGFGVIVPEALRQAHLRLRHAAEEAARASRVNSVVIRRVLESERTFLQSMFSDGPTVGYPGEMRSAPSGIVLDRQG